MLFYWHLNRVYRPCPSAAKMWSAAARRRFWTRRHVVSSKSADMSAHSKGACDLPAGPAFHLRASACIEISRFRSCRAIAQRRRIPAFPVHLRCESAVGLRLHRAVFLGVHSSFGFTVWAAVWGSGPRGPQAIVRASPDPAARACPAVAAR